MEVAILFDLVTRDGRSAVEVRRADPLGSGYFASAKQTLYSCAYSDELGRSVALNRAQQGCEVAGLVVVHYGDCKNSRRAAWQ